MRPRQLNLDLLGLEMSIHLVAKTSHYVHRISCTAHSGYFHNLSYLTIETSNEVFVPYQVRAVIKKAVKSDRVNNKFIVL